MYNYLKVVRWVGWMIIAYNAFAKCIAATIIYFGDIL